MGDKILCRHLPFPKVESSKKLNAHIHHAKHTNINPKVLGYLLLWRAGIFNRLQLSLCVMTW